MQTRIVVLASGLGSGFENLVQACRSGHLPGEVVGLISDRSGVGVLARAERLGVPSKVMSPKDFSDRDQWNRVLIEQLKSWRVDWVALIGFLSLLGPSVVAAFPGRVVNSHPSLLPKFGGKGMYGARVHQAVLAAKEKESGVTIHLVDEKFDHGRILAQERTLLGPEETEESLQERLKQIEQDLYVRVLRGLILGQFTTG